MLTPLSRGLTIDALYISSMYKFIIWYRRTDDPNALWGDMAYAPRYQHEAEQLVTHYEEEWGNLYEYSIHREGFYPPGTRQPCFVGIND